MVRHSSPGPTRRRSPQIPVSPTRRGAAAAWIKDGLLPLVPGAGRGLLGGARPARSPPAPPGPFRRLLRALLSPAPGFAPPGLCGRLEPRGEAGELPAISRGAA